MSATPSNDVTKKIFGSIHFWLPVTCCLLFIFLVILLTFINSGHFFTGFIWQEMIREGFLVLLQMISVMYFVYYALQFFDKLYSAENFTIRRNIYELIFVIIGGFLINKVFHLLFVRLVVVIPLADLGDMERRLNNLLVMNQVLVVVMYALMGSFRTFKNLQKKQLEVVLLQKEFAQTQFETLKNQLNPHFLFNSLSVLTSLVYVDAEKAEEFIDKLAKTYRYLLDQKDKEAVHVSDELQFLNNFKFLVGQRYGNKLQITEEVSNIKGPLFILPHALLIVLEYVIGSSTMSAAKPLQVEVTVTNKNLEIKYSWQPKELQTLHLLEQFNRLRQGYEQMNKAIRLQLNEGAQQQIIKIPFFNLHD